MTVDHGPPISVLHHASRADILLDGLFTGMIGAALVALWFFVLDLAAGQPLATPSLLGTVLLHGSEAARATVGIGPVEVAAYTAVHLIAFVAVGVALAVLMSLFDRHPIMFFVILLLFLGLMLGFFVLDLALGASLMGRLRPWTVVVANLLAAAGMALFQWRRHPHAFRNVGTLWEDPDGVPGR
jgi:hypothetical protein